MKGNKLIDDHIQIAINLAKLKSHGKTFEVAIDADKVVAYKEGEKIDIEELVQSPNIFSDMKKGLMSSDEDLKEVFSNTNKSEILKKILNEGEIQFTQKYRSQLREQKTKKIVNIIHRNAIDPKTGLIHPENRIIAAMEEAKIKINDLKKAEDQVNDIVKLLRPIIPISIEKVIFQLVVPTQYSAKVHGKIISFGKISEERWLNDGSLMTKIEIPAGLGQELVDLLNAITHGSCQVNKI